MPLPASASRLPPTSKMAPGLATPEVILSRAVTPSEGAGSAGGLAAFPRGGVSRGRWTSPRPQLAASRPSESGGSELGVVGARAGPCRRRAGCGHRRSRGGRRRRASQGPCPALTWLRRGPAPTSVRRKRDVVWPPGWEAEGAVQGRGREVQRPGWGTRGGVWKLGFQAWVLPPSTWGGESWWVPSLTPAHLLPVRPSVCSISTYLKGRIIQSARPAMLVTWTGRGVGMKHRSPVMAEVSAKSPSLLLYALPSKSFSRSSQSSLCFCWSHKPSSCRCSA